MRAACLLIVWLPDIRHVYSYDLRSLWSAERHGDSVESRHLLPSTISPRFRAVMLAAEEPDFYMRPAHSPVSQLVGAIAGEPRLRNGSIFAYQLAKWTLLDKPMRHGRWMVEGSLMSYRIEHELTKDEIFSAYLNGVTLVPETRGVAEAAQVHFGKSLDDLELAEMVYLAARGWADPCAKPAWAEKRSELILDRMAALGQIDATQREAASTEILTFRPDLSGCPSRR